MTIEQIVNSLKNLTLSELKTLILNLENEFQINITNNNQIEQNEIIDKQVDEKNSETKVDLILNTITSDKKIAALKLIRSLTGLGLKESKEIIDNLPKTLKTQISQIEAEEIKKTFIEIGAEILLK